MNDYNDIKTVFQECGFDIIQMIIDNYHYFIGILK